MHFSTSNLVSYLPQFYAVVQKMHYSVLYVLSGVLKDYAGTATYTWDEFSEQHQHQSIKMHHF